MGDKRNSHWQNVSVKSKRSKRTGSRIADLRWVRPPRQERSRKTLERLLNAAEGVIAEKGFDAAGVVEIASRAGFSVGAGYRRFRDKNALIRAVLDRGAAEFRSTLELAVAESRWQGASILEILEAYASFTLQDAPARFGLRRAHLELAVRDPAASELLIQLQRELHLRIRALLLARLDEVRHPEPELAIDFALQQLRDMLLVRLEGANLSFNAIELDRDRFLREALASVAAYLQLRPKRKPR